MNFASLMVHPFKVWHYFHQKDYSILLRHISRFLFSHLLHLTSELPSHDRFIERIANQAITTTTSCQHSNGRRTLSSFCFTFSSPFLSSSIVLYMNNESSTFSIETSSVLNRYQKTLKFASCHQDLANIKGNICLYSST